ncbi:MAG: hypothetical protein A3G18_13355 [Rhodospirillales bacterium RIFCSPLOWO2_12_FULL_58_28]|nr:MAG: hypothetical protein A3H92_13210 [Rhodospirillales bacterium RIFCSPLOWO2_02_FULL_58_16]OHC78563.1 MAG: hypothetical protein A3G18_13355 [Rhodospirillales bacterium RIFCSPLOWO2_12_FULL_58_28]
MATLARRSPRATNIWPGFVDALSTLLMVIIFLLMIFVLAQFFLGQAIASRDQALKRLEGQISELAGLLAMERKNADDLRLNVTQLSDELQASVIKRDELNAYVGFLESKAESSLAEVVKLSGDLAALRALKEEMETRIAEMSGKLDQSQAAVIEEKNISESARAQVALLNKQMAALREQLAQLSAVLDAAEKKAESQDVQIVSLGKRLNAALAAKVHELSRYRSEFFGRLREVLGDQKDVRIVGDRFVFQSEVLFASASDQLGEEGKVQLGRLAQTLLEISARIPEGIDWILQIDGHTDRAPIKTARFPSNWELSSARAISVVTFLVGQGIPPHRLTAAGFAEFYPLDDRKDEIGMRRNRRIELKLTQR